MVPTAQRPRLIAIVGPTASGKSGLATRLAKEFNGEVICADSRTVYKSMNIGTAKPSQAEQAEVPHWGLDLVAPGQVFSAAKFKKYAQAAIKDIQNRGKLPFLVGGTGLYVDGVLYDFSFIKTHAIHRLIYSSWSVEKLQKVIAHKDWPLPKNLRNPRHLTRTLERRGRIGSKGLILPSSTLLIGLMPTDEELKERIASRAEAMFKQGIVEETQELVAKYGQKAIGGTAGIVYKIVLGLLKGEVTEDQAKELFKVADWQYARRQKTWFKRNAHIKWFTSPEQAYKAAKKQLVNT
jgi:tRNA dimethylallyltransferase